MKDNQLENTIITLHDRGWPVRGLSREFGISRGRIRRLIERNRQQRETGLPLEVAQAKRASMLDQYKEYIAGLLTGAP